MSDFQEDLRVRAAWLYYKEGMTQDQVAQELGVTRTRVLRMLGTARQDGIVQIRVTAKQSRCVELERAIEERHGLERAIIIPTPVQNEQTSDVIGAVLGEFIADRLDQNVTIGLGWGKTLSSALGSIPQQDAKGISVVSLLGGLTKVSAFNPSEFAWRLGDRLSAECLLMAAPVFAPDAKTRDALMTHPGIREVFRRSEHLDLAIISVGDLSPSSTFVKYGLLEKEEIASLERAGAIGDVLCRFVNARGEIVDHQVNDRVIAVHPETLRSARKVVLASGGWQKLAVFKAAMKLLRPNIIVTDEVVAERLLGED
ncbi:sugar-binding transcriptional regulator [Ochrobactrum teleogrylli]|uniref:Sugar-binding transcriptional regulator n=1 Tax=Ochrobactrum teleogrylli TaxID=2479765 RepID=A0ABD5K0R0_9HYPH